MRHHLDTLAVFLAETIRRGNAEGAAPCKLDPEHSADLLLNLIAGIQVLAKGGMETHRLTAIIDVQLECLLGSTQ